MLCPLPRLLTPMQVAAWLSLPTGQVECLARSGNIPSVTLPTGDLVFDADALAAWVKRLPSFGQEVPRAS